VVESSTGGEEAVTPTSNHRTGEPPESPATPAVDRAPHGTWSAPCAADPTAWDLDAGTLAQWLAAMRQCVHCPVLDECVALRDAFFPAADSTHRSVGNPNGVIWTGIAYSESGVPLDGRGLRLYAARRRRRTAPTTADHHCRAPDTAAV
jgi:hypothetical protein